MAAKAAATGPAILFGGLLCIGLILFAIAAAIVLSLIPTFTTSSDAEQYGAVYSLDSFMLEFFYQNTSGIYFQNGTVANSTDLSQRCNTYFQSLGYKNFAGCLVFSGQAWGPNNTATNARRRRRDSYFALFGIFGATIYRTKGCPAASDKNKTSSSSSVSYCNKKALDECNALVNDLQTAFALWTSNLFTLQIINNYGYYESVSIVKTYGVPRSAAYKIASVLPNVDDGKKRQIQNGCRYVGLLPLSTINAILASQTASSVTSVTTQATG